MEDYCWYGQNQFPYLIPEYDLAKEIFKNRKKPSIEPGNVLLVLSDYDEYYFTPLYFKETEDTEGRPFYLENISNSILFAKTLMRTIVKYRLFACLSRHSINKGCKKTPLIEKLIDISDLVYTFCEVIAHIDLSRYFIKKRQTNFTSLFRRKRQSLR